MSAAQARANQIASDTPDPELAQLTLADLGILRSVTVDSDGVQVVLTPTYTGCPAMQTMRQDVARRLNRAGYGDVRVHLALSPPWSSDWITAEGRRKLAAAGIAAPHPACATPAGPVALTLLPSRTIVRCPQCGSEDTVRTATFGATACKALYRCDACAEPFEYMKAV